MPDAAAIASLPKVELHVHLEGAAPPDLVRQLATEKSLNIEGIFDAQGAYAFDNFAHFLKVYEAATAVFTTAADYARLMEVVLAQSAESGGLYSELFLSPDFCGGGDLGAWCEYLAAMREAAERAQACHGIVARGIITCVRHFGPDRARQAARCAAETAGDWVVGFGMAGDETIGRQGDFAWSFDCAREAGLHLTTHAGEFAGPESIRAALEDLQVARIGHGVRAIEDAALVAELARRGVVLETCPGSNLALGLYPSLAAHPIAPLRAAGVKVTVSTDDPPFFRTNMQREYHGLARAFGWQKQDLAALSLTAAQAAFCDETTRSAILERLQT
ncbi:MAG: adenosine deaminase [Rhodobacteraceae bacterium]|nr:adenosine deaminase [Paracoccaceae bacterium]